MSWWFWRSKDFDIRNVIHSNLVGVFESRMIFESGWSIRISHDIRIWLECSNIVTHSNLIGVFESRDTFESQDSIFEYPIAHDLQTNIRIY